MCEIVFLESKQYLSTYKIYKQFLQFKNLGVLHKIQPPTCKTCKNRSLNRQLSVSSRSQYSQSSRNSQFSRLPFTESSDDKSKKLDPIKRNQPEKSILFNAKDSILKLHTTLNHYETSDKIESKMFNIQVAYRIDGVKSVIQKEIDMAVFHRKGEDIQVMKIVGKPETEFKYRVRINLKEDKSVKDGEGQNIGEDNKNQNQTVYQRKNQRQKTTPVGQNLNFGSKSLSKTPLNNKSMKVIRFDEGVQQEKQEDNQASNKQKLKSIRSMKNLQDNSFKDVEQKDLKSSDPTFSKKFETLTKQLHDKSKELLKVTSKYSQLESKYKDLGSKFQKLNQKYSALVIEKQKSQSNNDTQSQSFSQNDFKKEKQKYQRLEKQYKKVKEHQTEQTKKLQSKQAQIKKLTNQVKTLTEQQKKNESKLKQLKQQNQQFEQLLLQMQSKSKSSTGPSLEQSLKPYKQRIKLLERQVDDIQQEKKFAQNQSKSKQDQVFQLRQKIKASNQESLRQVEEISNKQYEIEKLTKKVKDLENELKNMDMKGNKKADIGSDYEDEQDEDEGKNYNKFKSQKIIGGGNTNSITKLKAENNELKTKLSIAMKNLQNKQALLKKFDTFSKEGRKQIEEELQNLKKENQKLREKNEKGGVKSDLGGLESKMELEKVKKELDYKTKSERQLLIDKSQLESRNKTLQDDIVRSKESIANILNAIHDFGNQALIEQVNGFLG